MTKRRNGERCGAHCAEPRKRRNHWIPIRPAPFHLTSHEGHRRHAPAAAACHSAQRSKSTANACRRRNGTFWRCCRSTRRWIRRGAIRESIEGAVQLSESWNPVAFTPHALVVAKRRGFQAVFGLAFAGAGALLYSDLPSAVCLSPRPTRKATWRSGYATVCKTVYPGSIPGVASNNFNDLTTGRN